MVADWSVTVTPASRMRANCPAGRSSISTFSVVRRHFRSVSPGPRRQLSGHGYDAMGAMAPVLVKQARVCGSAPVVQVRRSAPARLHRHLGTALEYVDRRSWFNGDGVIECDRRAISASGPTCVAMAGVEQCIPDIATVIDV